MRRIVIEEAEVLSEGTPLGQVLLSDEEGGHRYLFTRSAPYVCLEVADRGEALDKLAKLEVSYGELRARVVRERL